VPILFTILIFFYIWYVFLSKQILYADIKQSHHWLEQVELWNNERLSMEAWKCLVSRCSRLSSLTLQLQDNSLGLLAVVAQSGRKLQQLEVVNAARPPIQEKLSFVSN
jgi:hypothetical protein